MRVIRSTLQQKVFDKSKALRRKIPQTEIAEKTGVTQATISKWMDMQKPLERIETSVLLALADYFDCDPLELLVSEKINQTAEEKETPEKVA